MTACKCRRDVTAWHLVCHLACRPRGRLDLVESLIMEEQHRLELGHVMLQLHHLGDGQDNRRHGLSVSKLDPTFHGEKCAAHWSASPALHKGAAHSPQPCTRALRPGSGRYLFHEVLHGLIGHAPAPAPAGILVRRVRGGVPPAPRFCRA